MRTVLVLTFVLVVATATTCFPQAAANTSQERLLYSVQNISPKTIAEKLGAIFNDGSVIVSEVPAASCVLISAPPKTMREIEGMLAKLDRRPRQVSIKVWIIDLQPNTGKGADAAVPENAPFFETGPRSAFLEQLAKLEKEGRVAVVNEFQFTTIDNQEAVAQQGERKPRVTASNITTRGRVNTVAFDNIGTLVKIQPRVVDNNELAMSIDVQKSFIAPESKGVPVDEPINGPVMRSPSYVSLVAKSTATMRSGEVTNVAGLKATADNVAGSHQVLIVAEILPEPAAK